MAAKIKYTGKTQTFLRKDRGGWQKWPVHGWAVWIDAKKLRKNYSPRAVAIAQTVFEFWYLNRGTQFAWRDTLAGARTMINGVGRITQRDYTVAREIIRECGAAFDEDERSFVYACTGYGTKAVSGFVMEPVSAVKYETDRHQELRVREGRIAHGTVEVAADEFGVPIMQKSMRTKTLK